jgi:hypothetical protein
MHLKYLVIWLMTLGFFVNSQAVCCCDDSIDALASEMTSSREMVAQMQADKIKTVNRMAIYNSVNTAMFEVTAGEVRSTHAAARFKDAIDTKETLEGLSAKATLDGAEIDSTITMNRLRSDAGAEQENIDAKSEAQK